MESKGCACGRLVPCPIETDPVLGLKWPKCFIEWLDKPKIPRLEAPGSVPSDDATRKAIDYIQAVGARMMGKDRQTIAVGQDDGPR